MFFTILVSFSVIRYSNITKTSNRGFPYVTVHINMCQTLIWVSNDIVLCCLASPYFLMISDFQFVCIWPICNKIKFALKHLVQTPSIRNLIGILLIISKNKCAEGQTQFPHYALIL
jgi:hypothetical protein